MVFVPVVASANAMPVGEEQTVHSAPVLRIATTMASVKRQASAHVPLDSVVLTVRSKSALTKARQLQVPRTQAAVPGMDFATMVFVCVIRSTKGKIVPQPSAKICAVDMVRVMLTQEYAHALVNGLAKDAMWANAPTIVEANRRVLA